MFMIRRSGNGHIVFRLSGRIEADELAEIQRQLATEAGRGDLDFDLDVALDLKDVTLVSQAAVEFLARCEANNVRLESCPGYIRKWIERVNGTTVGAN